MSRENNDINILARTTQLSQVTYVRSRLVKRNEMESRNDIWMIRNKTWFFFNVFGKEEE